MDLKICRVCLSKNATVSVFDKHGSMQYSAKIMRLVNVVILEDDGLPSSICNDCINELIISYDFVQKCESSDNSLRRLTITDNIYVTIEPCTDIKEEVKEENIKTELEYGFDNEPELDFEKSAFIETQDSDFSITKKEKTKKTRQRKKIKNTKMKAIQCVICGLMVNSPSAMDIHMRTHTGEKPFPCQSCEMRCPTKGALKRHIEIAHCQRERKFICETCGSSFFRKNDIIIHLRIHTDEKPYACPYCQKRFRQIASLIRHKRIHTGDKPYPCPICGKKFNDKSLVKKHLTVHSDERKFTCHLCNKSVKTKTALTVHMNLHTNMKENVCNFCGMAFSMKGNLKTHVLRAHSEKSGQCMVCMKEFSNLEDHMHKHTGEKPYICSICSHAFTTKRSLTYHMVFKHENAAKYKCSIGECAKTFPTITMLEFHLLKQHTNHTPYICPHCSRGFFRNSDLSRHLRVSHMDLQTKVSKKGVMSV